jgi:hypothetical protein
MMSCRNYLPEVDKILYKSCDYYRWVLALVIISYPKPNHDNIIIRGAFYYNAQNDEEPFT